MSIKTSFLTAIVLCGHAAFFAQNKATVYIPNQNAPAFSTKTILIHASRQKVWDVLSNIDAWSTWLTPVSKSKLNGDLKPNTTFDWKTGSTKIHSQLHTVDPYAQLGWTGKVYGIYAIHTWSFKEVNGFTEVTVTESMEGFLAKLLKKSVNKTLEKDMIQSLELLKKACE